MTLWYQEANKIPRKGKKRTFEALFADVGNPAILKECMIGNQMSIDIKGFEHH